MIKIKFSFFIDESNTDVGLDKNIMIWEWDQDTGEIRTENVGLQRVIEVSGGNRYTFIKKQLESIRWDGASVVVGENGAVLSGLIKDAPRSTLVCCSCRHSSALSSMLLTRSPAAWAFCFLEFLCTSVRALSGAMVSWKKWTPLKGSAKLFSWRCGNWCHEPWVTLISSLPPSWSLAIVSADFWKTACNFAN